MDPMGTLQLIPGTRNVTFVDQTVNSSRQHGVDALQQAARFLEKCLARDNSAPSLIEQLNNNPQCGPMASGLSDHDYPNLTGLPLNLSNKTQIRTLSKVPLPPEVLEHFNHMQCHCMMGLFTEINRAWVTIDSDIYVWTYEDGGDVAYFDGMNETIISVGLIKPKPGVFQNYIKYLLVLTTAIDIIVLGVTFANENNDETCQEIHLVSEPVFTIPTDGSIIRTVVGSNTGRLFLGGKDGCLYEITYQAESSWFGKRCKKINHSTSKLAFLVPSFAYVAMTEEDPIAEISIDNSRHILYILTEKGSIEVYDMGEHGNSMSRIIKVSQNSLVQQAQNTVRTLDSQNFYPIISISAVELSESARIHLVAISQSGARLYLTTTTQSQVNLNLPRPTALSMMHVRLPPGYSATTQFRPRNIYMANYRERNVMMISSVSEKDVLWGVSSDLFPFAPVLIEACTTIELDGPALAMGEIKYNPNELLQPTQQIPPLIVRQHSEAPRKFVILSAQGAHIIIKLRPVDLLKQLLIDTHGQDSDALKAYFAIQQDDQACATSLILASLESPQNANIADFATSAFFTFGGEPSLQQMMNTSMNMTQTANYTNPSIFMPNVMSTPMGTSSPYNPNQSMAPNTSMSFQTNPYGQQYPQNMNSPTAQNLTQNTMIDVNSPFQYSSKHNGLYLYVGRILRSFWNLRCVEKMTLDGRNFYLTSTVSSEDCAWVLVHLNSLHAFLQRNTQLSICNNKNTMQPQNTMNQLMRSNYTLQDAQLEERHSLDALKLFVNHAAQVLGVWKIFCEHQFHVLVDKLPDDMRQQLQNTCFKDLILYRQDVCSALINTLINSYLGDNASVDSISTKLRDVCPSLYKIEDAACSKANEILKAAKLVNNLDEKEEMLMAALMLCKNVAPIVNLKEICEQFTCQKSYKAVMELCACCAKKVDPENIAVHFYKTGDANDRDGFQLYNNRMEIYKQVVSMLETVYTQHDLSLNIQNISGQNANTNPEGSSNITKQIICEALKYPDELLHVAVYDWMMSKQLNGELIALSEGTLETYLVQTSQRNPNNILIMDLLWKYYESNNNHAAAARILNTLACTSNPSVKLRDRLSYLARALMCMRSDKVGYAPYLGVFLRELEDKLEITKVQERILESISNLRGVHPDAEIAESHLNTRLYEITQLYEDFAEKFNLWESKLAIIDCAGYTDKVLIENIWRNILQNELRRTTACGNDTVIHIISKVRSLIRLYKISSTCIPLDYLIKEMELISAKLKADASLVPNFFVSCDYPIDTLILIYNESMITSIKEEFWLREENEFHYSEAIAALITAFIHTNDKFNSVEKRKIIAMSQDSISSILSNLYSKPNTEQIVTQLRTIQAKLSRM